MNFEKFPTATATENPLKEVPFVSGKNGGIFRYHVPTVVDEQGRFTVFLLNYAAGAGVVSVTGGALVGLGAAEVVL